LNQLLKKALFFSFIPLKYYEGNIIRTLIWYTLLPSSNLPYFAGLKPNISVLSDFRKLIAVQLDVTRRFSNVFDKLISCLEYSLLTMILFDS